MPTANQIADLSYSIPERSRKIAVWVTAPISVIYIALLNLYALKILFTQSLPKGWASWPITIAYALVLSQEIYLQLDRPRLPDWFGDFITKVRLAFIPLWVLMAVAIFVRISEYGFTEPRFFLLLGFVFLVATWASTLRSDSVQVRRIFAFLAIYLVIFIWKPLQPIELSRLSQYRRAVGILPKLKTPDKKIDTALLRELKVKEFKRLRSSLEYLKGTKWEDDLHIQLKAVFSSEPETVNAYYELLERMKRFYIRNDSFDEDVTVDEKADLEDTNARVAPNECLTIPRTYGGQLFATAFDIKKYDYVLDLGTIRYQKPDLIFISDTNTIHFVGNGKDEVILDLKEVALAAIKKAETDPKGFHVNKVTSAGLFDFYFDSLTVNCVEGTHFDGLVFYKLNN